jgi:hypothetical protein
MSRPYELTYAHPLLQSQYHPTVCAFYSIWSSIPTTAGCVCSGGTRSEPWLQSAPGLNVRNTLHASGFPASVSSCRILGQRTIVSMVSDQLEDHTLRAFGQFYAGLNKPRLQHHQSFPFGPPAMTYSKSSDKDVPSLWTLRFLSSFLNLWRYSALVHVAS